MTGDVRGRFRAYLLATGRSAATIAAYGADLRELGRFVRRGRPGEPDLAALPPGTIPAFLEREARRRSPATVARRAATLRAFLGWLGGAGLPELERARRVWVPPPAPPSAAVPTAAQLALLQERADRDGSPTGLRDAALVRLLLGAGLRASEALGLAVGDVDAGWVTIGDDPRPLDEPTAAALLAYLERGRPALARSRSSAALFLNRRGGRLTRCGAWLRLGRLARAAGLRGPVSARVLRRACALGLLERGVPYPEAASALGYAGPGRLYLLRPARAR